MPAPAPTVSAIDLAHATEEQLFYIGELTEALPALLEADRALTEIFVCGRLYLEGDYGAVDPYTPFPVEQGEKYADFAEITALFDDAVPARAAPVGRNSAYPAYGRPAVSERDRGDLYHVALPAGVYRFLHRRRRAGARHQRRGASLYAVTPGGQGVYFGARSDGERLVSAARHLFCVPRCAAGGRTDCRLAFVARFRHRDGRGRAGA